MMKISRDAFCGQSKRLDHFENGLTRFIRKSACLRFIKQTVFGQQNLIADVRGRRVPLAVRASDSRKIFVHHISEAGAIIIDKDTRMRNPRHE